jgi:hypothetical protein
VESTAFLVALLVRPIRRRYQQNTTPVLDTGVSGTAVTDEDDMVSDSARIWPHNKSIKADLPRKNSSLTVALDMATRDDSYCKYIWP